MFLGEGEGEGLTDAMQGSKFCGEGLTERPLPPTVRYPTPGAEARWTADGRPLAEAPIGFIFAMQTIPYQRPPYVKSEVVPWW